MVGIICFWDREATPYLAKYEGILNEQKIDYEVVFWNRVTAKEQVSVENRSICLNHHCVGTKQQKIGSFFWWRKTIIKIIKKRKYDHLIVLSTIPAVLLFFQLVFKYSDRFIFDIRDYTFEKYRLCKAIVMTLIKRSCLTPISSKGFMKWLNKSDKIIVNHNITVEKECFSSPSFGNKDRYNFAFVGNVRLDTQTRALLLNLKSSHHFNQYYYGRIVPGCDIEELKQSHHIENLYLTGPFSVEDKPRIFKNIDLINCVYANAEKEVDIPLGDSTPLPNRLYDALTFYKPIVASKGTYLADLVQKYKIGCCINGFDDSAEEEILRYVRSFNCEEFVDGCNALKKKVIEEERAFKARCCSVLQQWKRGEEK